ncbi:hypothetical protein C8R45DRAFT_1033309, partial [Mycena sanguinolenta]
TAAKEKKQLRMLSLIPFLKSSRARPAKQPKYEGEDEDDRDSEGVASVDSDSDDDEDWRERERRKWGKAPPFQHSAADFMSNGMTPVAAPAIMASGSGAGQQPVLLGWNFPEQMQQQFHSQSPQLWLQRPQSQSPPSWLHPPQQSMSPPPWAYPYAYQRSPAPWGSAPGPDMNQVAANLNALGLYAV